ncbi:MAG: cupin domain-containing protein [Solirubrobacteraceae bacterium]
MSSLEADRVATMAIDDLPSLYDGLIKLARSGLGITAFGVQVMDLPPDYTTQSHDESGSGQQELYVGLRGAGWVLTDEQRLPIGEGMLIRIDAGVGRRLASGPDGVRIMCVGGLPGGVYQPPDWTAE